MIAGLAAQKFGRPVRLTLTSSEDMIFGGAKHEAVVNYHVTFDKSGKIISAKFKAFANSGFTLDMSIVWTQVPIFFYFDILNDRIFKYYKMTECKTIIIMKYPKYK